MANIIVIILIFIALVLSIRSVIRSKRNGKSCGFSDCSSCSSYGMCGSKSHEKKD